ncbi:uncharacterized protein LOC120104827 [Phoenix dactylifera]|uniref:Uncharacterized protein LOC120104827 n=1 Tax=Phoenix dactylifera TaxID=42345 RepID=A0A8B8ZH16_PHODC|nr:uncharacterized protein LOC120104827 [Phoenix dactylifera]
MCKSIAFDIWLATANKTDEAFKDPLSIPHNGAFTDFEGAFVKGVDSLSWMANNTSKLFPLHSDMPQCWTFFSTAAYGKRNKVPQENIPKVTAEKVKEDLLNDVEFALGLSKGSLQCPFYTRVQLWGAALPTNTPGIPCIFDPHVAGHDIGQFPGLNSEKQVLEPQTWTV